MDYVFLSRLDILPWLGHELDDDLDLKKTTQKIYYSASVADVYIFVDVHPSGMGRGEMLRSICAVRLCCL